MKPKFASLHAAFAPLRRSSLIVVASVCSASSAHADRTWTGDPLDGFWTSTGNWSGAAIPGTGDVAIFDANSDTNTATTLAATFSIKGLKIVDPIAAVSIAAGNTLTLDSSGIDMSAAIQNLNIDSPLVAGVSQAWNIATGRTLTVSSVVSGTSFTKSGDGLLLLRASANTITGTVQHNGGQITVRNGASLGPNTNTLALANGTIFRIETTNGGAGSGSGVFVGSPISMATAASATVSSNSAGNGYSGLVTGDAASVFNINIADTAAAVSFNLGANTQQFGSLLGRVEIHDGATARFSSTSGVNNGGASAIWDTNTSGTITTRNSGTVNLGSLVGTGTLSGSSGATGTAIFVIGGRNESNTFDGSIIDGTPGSRIGAVTKVGTETLTLTSATGLTYGGATNVNEGTLKINGVKSGAGSTTVKTTTTLTGTGSIAGTTTVQSGGTLAPGDGGVGNITFSNLTLNTGSTLNVQFGVGNDKATVSAAGTLNLQSGINVDVNGFDTDGTYTIFDVTAAGAGVTGSASTAFTPINHNASKIYLFKLEAGLIQMTISTSDPSNYWNAPGSGSWATAGNWTKTPVIPNVAGAIAKFGPGQGGLGGSFASSFAVTLDGNKTVGLLSFNDDFGSVVTIDPGLVTPGTLLMDNGLAAAEIVTLTGDHIINAPVSVDAQGLTLSIGSTADVVPIPYSLTINGVVGGIDAALVKNGTGHLFLTGDNTYGGGTVLAGGRTSINSATSLGATAGALTFSGGSLQLTAPLTGITRGYLLTGGNYANIDTNGNDFGYDGVISPVGGATGGITKSGAGIMTLGAVQTYTGATAISGGILSLAPTASINAAGINAYAGGSIRIDGGSYTTTAGSSLTNGSDIVLNSGSATLAAVGTPSNSGDGCLIGVNGGIFAASSVTLHRTYNAGAALPTIVPADTGFVVTNGTATVSGTVTIGTSNSSASALVSGGSLSVGGQFTLGNIVTGGRYCTLRVTGGSFTSTDAVNGVVLSTHATTANSAAVLLNGGTTTIERFSFGDGDSAVDSIGALVLDGAAAALYMGAQGIVQTSPNAFAATINLNQGTLGAKANWSSSLPMNLTGGAVIIKAADALDAAFDITLSGVLSGAGGFEKTGGGKLTLSGINTYSGNTTVTQGMLEVANDDVFDDASTVTIAPGATLNLTHNGTDIVGMLIVNGATMGNGLYTFGTGKLQVGAVVSTPFQDWAISKGLDGTPGKENGMTDDPDKDGRTNLSEFAFNGNPLSGSDNGQVYVLTADSDADSPDTAKELILTLAVRKTTPAFTAGAPATAPLTDGINYSIQGSTNLASFGVTVTPVGFVDPGVALTDAINYEYRSFSLSGSNGLTGKGFMRANAVAP